MLHTDMPQTIHKERVLINFQTIRACVLQTRHLQQCQIRCSAEVRQRQHTHCAGTLKALAMCYDRPEGNMPQRAAAMQLNTLFTSSGLLDLHTRLREKPCAAGSLGGQHIEQFQPYQQHKKRTKTFYVCAGHVWPSSALQLGAIKQGPMQRGNSTGVNAERQQDRGWCHLKC